MKKLFSLAILILLGCSSDDDQFEEPVFPKAVFSASKTTLVAGETISFIEESEHALSYEWEFLGGDPAISSEQNPSVSYPNAGTYSVTLTVTNEDGEDTETKTDYISVSRIETPPLAAFSSSETAIEAGEDLSFTDESTNAPTSWAWEFPGGDPATSSEQNPSVTYTDAGTYSVTLTVTNADGEDTEIKTDYISVSRIETPPLAAFSGSETDIEAGEDLSFTDESTNAPTSWAWEFPGGDPATSSEQNPSVTYPNAGTYSVTLTVTNEDGENTETKTDYISVSRIETPPLAAFSGSETAIEAGEDLSFTDESTNSPTSWAWEFPGGDPATSSEQNPSVSYPNAGTYSVTLTVANEDGEDTETKTDYISVSEPVLEPVADFTASETTITSGRSIVFTDTSGNIPDSWEWSFEGGSPANSTERNPMVRYNNFGVYSVTLSVTNAAGTDTETKTGYITVNQQTASYTVTFTSNWNRTNHPIDFPSNNHFSNMVGMTHKPGIRFFEDGQLASLGIKDVAERGQNAAISNEIQDIVNSGGALSFIDSRGGLATGTTETSFIINVTEEFPLISLVSMIAPSPDWFVAIEDIRLFSEGAFLNTFTVASISYDSGTDSGLSFNSADNVTSPPEPIFEITEAPLGNGTEVDPPVAFFTFVKN